MSVTPITCCELVCDGCGQVLNPADEGVIHFNDAAEARSQMRWYEWTQVGERDLCPPCAGSARCDEDGHVPALDAHGEYCDRCEEKLP